MQPLKPDEKNRILEENPQAAPEDVERYQKLLSERFTIDPDQAQTAPLQARKQVQAKSRAEAIEDELRMLHERIFSDRKRSQAGQVASR